MAGKDLEKYVFDRSDMFALCKQSLSSRKVFDDRIYLRFEFRKGSENLLGD